MNNGSKAWVGLAAYVGLYDGWAVWRKSNTMSEAFHEAFCHPFKRWPVGVAWVYITCHLFHVIPDHVDPLRRWPAQKFPRCIP